MTITQATETGHVYCVDEIEGYLALQRARPAAAHGRRAVRQCLRPLGCTPAEMTWRAGVDVLCFGGTKNGMAVGEAVVFFNRELAEDFDYRCKQAGQLASKMRFLAAPWVGMLESGAWLATPRTPMPARAAGVRRRGPSRLRTLTFPVEANAVFLRASADRLDALRQRGWQFYTFIGGGARFMFAWDADPRWVDKLADDIAACATNGMMFPPLDLEGSGCPA